MPNLEGVYPCYKNQFQVGKSKEALTNILDMETFSIAFDNEIQEWKPYDMEGWTRRLMTAKSITISVNGKRNVGDTGNDFVAGLAFLNGTDVTGVIQWTFPDGTKIIIPCVYNVTNLNTGDTANVAPLEFETLSDGKPEVVAPVKN